jgi:hypothetical protein
MWTNAMFEALGWAFWPSPPAPLPKWFKGGQNMWTNAMFEALGWAFWPSPPAPLPKWERGDSGARVWHPIAVHSYYEHLFCPPLNAGGGREGFSMTLVRCCAKPRQRARAGGAPGHRHVAFERLKSISQA